MFPEKSIKKIYFGI